MDSGKVLLVNLKRSKHLSPEGAKTFGALLVNQFFEAAMERKQPRPGRDPNPYYLYMDEFQNFVSLDITRMLAEVRKCGLFLIMAHQYFEQLDEQVTAAAMNNCQIKAVFGGLAVANNAERMARETFIGQLDPYKVMAAIYQTKFWPVYDRDQVHTHGTAHGTSTPEARRLEEVRTPPPQLPAAQARRISTMIGFLYPSWPAPAQRQLTAVMLP